MIQMSANKDFNLEENSKVKTSFKIDLVSHPARLEGLVVVTAY